ncbi:hypothetical protein [Klebsiella quasipneumoniae]|uniref:hypothetical protein n=1 Tax=Klebsiella quasipneumoniae TaxID=1463165 RepID=UPI00128BA28E|nr:hypothetical protein [Klebsiella quasipneumoniae]QFU66285.1 hypothetical protein EQH50_16410 [Klebsiella quasipneumoniae]
MALLAPYPCSRCRFFVGWRLTPYPTYGPYHCELKLSTLSLSPWLLKLPVLVATGATGPNSVGYAAAGTPL